MITVGIELGGTKTVVAVGKPTGELHQEYRYPTTTPEETLDQAIGWIKQQGIPEAIGIGSFGPLGVVPSRADYGVLQKTPKPGWSGFSMRGHLQAAFPDARLVIETDVNAAALAETTLGAAAGLSDVAYITIGTGIGAGFVHEGRLVCGYQHPEFGHFKVPRFPGDEFPGLCPYHADCLEGMASGPAIHARWKAAAAALPADHPAWEMEAWYLAHGILAMLAIVSPERVILGGGVSQAANLHALTEKRLVELAAGYFPQLRCSPYIVPPGLGQQAGIVGALLLAGTP